MLIETLAFKALDVAAGAGKLFIIDSVGRVARWNARRRRLENQPQSPESLIRLTVDSTGAPWALGRDQRVHRQLPGGTWERMDGRWKDVRAVPNRQEIFGVSTSGKIKRFSNSATSSTTVHPAISGVRSIAPLPSGDFLRVDDDDRMHWQRRGRWQELPDRGIDVFGSAKVGRLYCLRAPDRRPMRLHNRRFWITCSLDVDRVRRLAEFGSVVWVVDDDQRVHRHATGLQWRGKGLSSALVEELRRISLGGRGVRAIACPEKNGFVIVTTDNRLIVHGRVRRDFANAIRERHRRGEKILVLATLPGGANWIVVTDRGVAADRRGEVSRLVRQIKEAQARGETVRSIAFSGFDRYLIATDSGFHGIGFSPFLRQAIENIRAMDPLDDQLTHVAFGHFGAVLLSRRVQEEGFITETSLFRTLKGLRDKEFNLHSLTTVGLGGWLALTRHRVHPDQLLRHPHGFERAARTGNPRHSMISSKIPGMAVAIIKNNKLQWAGGYGRVHLDKGIAVKPDSLFQVASITKTLVALGIFRLIEAKHFTLDTDVTDLLRGWRPPAADGVDLGQTPLRIRHLLAHSGCTSVHGFTSIEDPDDLPTTMQILRSSGPAENDAVEVMGRPGTGADYSGGGYQILQKIIEDVSGLSFPRFMERQVLRPLGMTRSTFDRFHDGKFANRHLAFGHRDGEAVRRHPPALAAGGLYSTAEELARVIIMINRGGILDGKRFLKASSIRSLLTREHNFAMFDDRTGQKTIGRGWGLGVDVSHSAAGMGRRSFRFNHGGSQIGYRSLMAGFPNRRTGAVVLLNATPPDSVGDFRGAIMRLIERIYP